MSPINEPKRRWLFECVAASYSAPGFFCSKGFKIEVFEGDPRLSWFQNRSFKATALAPAVPSPGAIASKPSPDSEGAEPGQGGDTLESLFSARVVTALNDAGIETLEDAIGYTEEELSQIPGVGPATIKKILSIAQ